MHFQAFSKGNLSFHLNNVHFKDKEFMCRMCHFKTAYKGEHLDSFMAFIHKLGVGWGRPFKPAPRRLLFSVSFPLSAFFYRVHM